MDTETPNPEKGIGSYLTRTRMETQRSVYDIYVQVHNRRSDPHRIMGHNLAILEWGVIDQSLPRL